MAVVLTGFRLESLCRTGWWWSIRYHLDSGWGKVDRIGWNGCALSGCASWRWLGYHQRQALAVGARRSPCLWVQDTVTGKRTNTQRKSWSKLQYSSKLIPHMTYFWACICALWLNFLFLEFIYLEHEWKSTPCLEPPLITEVSPSYAWIRP